MLKETTHQVKWKRRIYATLLTITASVLIFSCSGGGSSGTNGGTGSSGSTGNGNVDDPTGGPVTTGQALLGPLTGAQVSVCDYTDMNTPIHTTTTSIDSNLLQAGSFDIPVSLLEDSGLYIITISGGDDIDANDDGVIDTNPTTNIGSLHLVATGSRLKKGYFNANILTEIIYRKIRYLLLSQYPGKTIETVMNRYISALLKADVDGDRDMDMDDILAWSPVIDRDKSTRSWGFLSDCVWAVHNNAPFDEEIYNIRENIVNIIDTPNFATQMVIRDQYAFLVDSDGYSGDRDSSLQVIDINDPANPSVTGSVDLPGNARALAISGDYAYVADGHDGLTIVRISNPVYPYVAGNVDTSGTTRNIAVSGNTAFLTNYRNGHFDEDLVIIDISDPRSPAVLATLDLPGIASCVALSGTTAYVAAGSSGMHIVDISDPSVPVLEKTYERFSYDVYSVKTSGRYAFTLESESTVSSTMFRVLDISSPTNPVYVSNASIPTTNVGGIVLSGDMVYLHTRSHGIVAVDISNLAKPKVAYSIDTPGGYLNDISVSGNHAYVSASDIGVIIVDLSRPDSERTFSNLDTYDQVYRVKVKGNYAYVADYWGGLNIVNIADPTYPSFAGRISNGIVKDFALSGNYAVIANLLGGGNLEIWDTSDPRMPVKVSDIDTWRESVAVTGDYILVGAGMGGLRIFEMSDPYDPTFVGEVDTPGDAQAVTVFGSYALVADGEEGVQVIDISNPADPEIVATISTTLTALDVAVSGNNAWIAEETRVIGVSLTDPPQPSVFARIAVPGTAQRVTVSEGWLYVSTGSGGIQLVDIRDLSDVHLDCGIATSHEAMDVAVANNHIYVADNESGLSIFNAVQ